MKIIRRARKVGTVAEGDGFAEHVGMPIVSETYWNGERFVFLADDNGSDNRVSMWSNAPRRATIRKALEFAHPSDRIELVDSLTGKVLATYQQGTL